MSEVSRVARFIFHVTLGKSRIFLSYLMLCLHRVVRPPFSVMLWQRRGNYPPFIVIARLRKAEYRLRQIPSSSLRTDGVGGGLAFGMPLSPIVIARLGKAEAIRYKHLNHYINVFSRKDYQTGLLRSARNDAGGGRPDSLVKPKNDERKRCHPELVSGSHYSIYPLVFVCKIYEMPKQVRHDNLVCVDSFV